MGSAGDSPAPVGDSPNGTTAAIGVKAALALASDALPIPSGESPDVTGQWPVLPGFAGSVCYASVATMRNKISTRFGSVVT